jgi:hypothetical protein
MRTQKPLPILAALENDPQLQARIDAVENRVKRTLEMPALERSLTQRSQPRAEARANRAESSRDWRLR